MEQMIKEVIIVSPDEGLITGCEVEDLGRGLYVLLEHPIMSDTAMFGDTIEAVEESPGQIRFVKVVKKSESKNMNLFLQRKLLNQSHLRN